MDRGLADRVEEGPWESEDIPPEDVLYMRIPRTSESIRSLARDGMSVADIARRLGIRYQHAYKVLKDSNMLPAPRPGNGVAAKAPSRTSTALKPPLTVEALVRGGFEFSARWTLTDAGDLTMDRPLPKAAGVYAFAKEGIAVYVGVATMGLAKRLYFYANPGPRQRTSQRLNRMIRSELRTLPYIDIYTAMPPDLEWNGLPVNGNAGLELGLIKKFALPWNMRSAG
jgi:hypothetical protein